MDGCPTRLFATQKNQYLLHFSFWRPSGFVFLEFALFHLRLCFLYQSWSQTECMRFAVPLAVRNLYGTIFLFKGFTSNYQLYLIQTAFSNCIFFWWGISNFPFIILFNNYWMKKNAALQCERGQPYLKLNGIFSTWQCVGYKQVRTLSDFCFAYCQVILQRENRVSTYQST